MIEVGRLCVKVAGRDAGLKGVIVDIIDDTYVLIDGEVRRRKCNIKHLEPLPKKLNISKGASHEEVVKAFKEELKIEIKERKPKEQKEKPKKQRKHKVKEDKKEKTENKKEAKKKEEASEKEE